MKKECGYKQLAKEVIALCMMLLLVACGGGGGGSTAKQDQAAPLTPPTSINTAPSQSPPTSINASPALTGSPVTSITVGGVYNFRPGAVDSDGDRLVFSIRNRPVWANFSKSTGRLSGAPTVNDVGLTSNIVITLSDGIANVSSSPFSIRVDAAPTTNSAPTLTGNPSTSISVGSGYSFLPVADDIDGDNLIFSIANRPVWANFSKSTGLLSGSPGANNVGTTSNIVITVSDGTVSVASTAFSIRVDAAATTNSGPTLSGTPATSITVGEVYSFHPVAHDSDGDPLEFTIQNLPVWASFDRTTGLLSGSPSVSDIGSTSGIVITVSDGTASAATASFVIRVDKSSLPIPESRKYHPGHYVSLYKTDGTTEMIRYIKPNVIGMQRRYSWKDLEPRQGVYDFSKPQADMDFLARQGMRLIIVVEDKSFDGSIPLPLYMDSYNLPNEGKVSGYTAKRWDPYVVTRFKALFAAMGKKFDTQPYFEGVGIQETSLGLPKSVLTAQNYTPERYRDALVNVISGAAQSFPTSRVFWYMNFLPGHQSYLADIATAVAHHGVVMGGPDVLPDDSLLANMVYPLYSQFKGKIKLFCSVQFDSYRHLHADPTATTKYWTPNELLRFSRDKLHVNYLIWNRTTRPIPRDSYHWPNAVPIIVENPVVNP